MLDWQTIRYPEPLRPGDTIAVTAPSSGVSAEGYPCLDACIEHVRALGYDVREGPCLRANAKHVSGPRGERIAALMALWQDRCVRALIPPRGGHLVIHLLGEIEFERLAALPPTWLLGYSDISALLLAITTLTGIATAHGPALMEMGRDHADPVSESWRKVLATEAGGMVTLASSLRYRRDWPDDPLAPLDPAEPTRWRVLRRGGPTDAAEMTGRIIGGCLETLSVLVGTPYGDVPAFVRRAGDDGAILYLENCEQSPTYVCRMLWNMRLAGWFDGLRGVVLGRSGGADADCFSYVDALHDVFDDLALPVVYEADIGHLPPQMTVVNGSLATVRCADGAAKLAMRFE